MTSEYQHGFADAMQGHNPLPYTGILYLEGFAAGLIFREKQRLAVVTVQTMRHAAAN
jgi:hypothetical protein